MNWYQLYKFAQVVHISREELLKRLTELGWKSEMTGSEAEVKSTPPKTAVRERGIPADEQGIPNITGYVLWSWHQYDEGGGTWRAIREDFVHWFPSLGFVWKNPFIIPDNFNFKTQSTRQISQQVQNLKPPILERALAVLPQNRPIQILHKNKWETPGIIDVTDNSIMLENGEIVSFPSPSSKVKYRELPNQPIRNSKAKRVKIIAIRKI